MSAVVSMEGDPCGARCVLRVGEAALYGDIPATGEDLREISLGRMRLPAGRNRIEFAPDRLKWGYLFCRLEKVILSRVRRGTAAYHDHPTPGETTP